MGISTVAPKDLHPKPRMGGGFMRAGLTSRRGRQSKRDVRRIVVIKYFLYGLRSIIFEGLVSTVRDRNIGKGCAPIIAESWW